ncbi:MAG: TonB-dependent receptor [Thalassotalea sp.]|nr:TonB-dependent receptor [Thalassotalea sp.]
MSGYSKSKVAIAVSLLCGLTVQKMAYGEEITVEQAENLKLEVIEVTSQKRVENIQDVPISVAAMSAEELQTLAVDKVDDLQLYIPNLSMTETGLSTQTFIRGIGTGNNQGFEQSVVQFVDGVSYARQQLSRAPFFDMERAEVLRGPQSILFGKNAIGGALNLSTARVEEENLGSVSYKSGERGISEFQGIINGELIDSKLFGRLSYRYFEEDGYIYNETLARDELDREETTVRAKLLYLATTDTTINFKYERNAFDSVGKQIEVLQDEGNPGNPYGVTLGNGFGLTQALPETDLDYVRTSNGDVSNNESNVYLLTINSGFEGFDIEAKTAWLDYKFDENCDCDFVGANIFTVPMNEEYEQFSQEGRFSSNVEQTLNWQFGFFYQHSTLDFDDAIVLPSGNVGEPQNAVLPTAVTALTGSPVFGASLSGVSAARVFEQDSESFSIFGEAVWNVTPELSVAFGARWTREKKDAERSLNILDNATQQVTTNPLSPLVLAQLFGIESEQTTGHSLADKRTENELDPSIKIQYYLDDNFMLYANASKGTKAGGFDARANSISSFEFKGEEAIAYELGMKNTFWQGRARLNAAVFFTDYEDLQVSQFDGTLGFVVGNASAEIKGIEVDGSVMLTEDIILSFAGAYLDHEFTDYKNGNCYYQQQNDTLNPHLASRYDANTGLCDYTGLTGQFTPEFSGNLNLAYFTELTSEIEFSINANYNYTDKQNVHQNLDPDWQVDSVGLVTITAALQTENWGIELLGANVTDEKVVTFASNVPLSGTFGADTVNGFIAPPSTWSLRGYYYF